MTQPDRQPAKVGVDGARRNWIAVWLGLGQFEYAIFDSPIALVAAFQSALVIAVDIPIGLSDHGGRDADAVARKFVGARRACSIFSAPVRGALHAENQADASRIHREIDGRGVSAQAFGILPKIRDWGALVRSDERARSIVYEVHPEVSFAELNGGLGLVAPKKSADGARFRRALLAGVFGDAAVAGLLSRVPRREAAKDDVLDALVSLWTAERIALRQAKCLPAEPRIDSAGLRCAIWY